MNSIKKTIALLLALLCLAFAACAPAGDAQPGATAASTRPDGKVYTESAIELGDIPNIQELRMLRDGTLAGIGVEYGDTSSTYSMFRLSEDGVISNHVKFPVDNQQGSKQFNYFLDNEGNAYVYEVDMSQYWGSPMEEPIAEDAVDENGTEEAEGDGEEGDEADNAADSDAAADDDAAEAEADGPAASPTPAPMRPRPRAANNAPTRPVLRKFDAFGKETSSITLPELSMQGEGENAYPDVPYNFRADSSSDLLYAMGNMELFIYDINTGELVKSVSTANGNMYDVTPVGDGFVASYGYDQTAGGMFMRCFNPITNEERWNKTTGNMPENLAYNPVDGKLYARAGRRIISYGPNGEEETLLELTDFSVLSPFYWMRTMVVGNEGTVYCILAESSGRERYIAEREETLKKAEALLTSNPDLPREEFYNTLYGSSPSYTEKSHMVRLALTDAANVPAVTEITVSVMYEDYNLMSMASAFHASNPGIRIKLKEMIPQDEMNSPDADYDQLIQRVNTEIISGRAADVLLLSNLPFQSYGEKNILEDLLPFMENDPDFNMADYRQNVFSAFMQNGKLTALPIGFQVPIFISKKGEFTQPDVTSADFFAKLKAIKKEQMPGAEYMRDATSIFYQMMETNIQQFEDENGNIMLDSPEFIGFLQDIKAADDLYKSLPAQEEYGMEGGRAYSARAMPVMPGGDEENPFVMSFDTIYGYYAGSSWKQQYGQDLELRFMPSLRLPNVKGFSTYSLYGMNRSSQNKDAAWQFLKFLISEPMQSSDNVGYGGVPVNIRAGEKLVALQLREADLERRQYALDQRISANDEQSEEDPYYAQYMNSLFTQADADLIESMISQVDTLLSYDSTVLTMANEELDPYLKGQKSAEETAKTLQSRLSMYISERD